MGRRVRVPVGAGELEGWIGGSFPSPARSPPARMAPVTDGLLQTLLGGSEGRAGVFMGGPSSGVEGLGRGERERGARALGSGWAVGPGCGPKQKEKVKWFFSFSSFSKNVK